MLAGLGKAAADLSYYAVARNSASMLGFIPALLRSVMFPASAEFYAQKDRARLQALFTFMVKHLFCFLFPLSTWMAFLAPVAITVIAGETYLPAAQALVWIAFFISMRAFGVPFFTCLVGALGRTKDQFYISALSGGLNVLLNYFFIPKFGFMGAVYATAICHGLSFSMAWFFLRSHMKLIFPVYPMLICVGLSCTTGWFLWLCMGWHMAILAAALPFVAIVYALSIIRFGIFDLQDVGYLKNILPSLTGRYGAVDKYLLKYARPTKTENLL